MGGATQLGLGEVDSPRRDVGSPCEAVRAYSARLRDPVKATNDEYGLGCTLLKAHPKTCSPLFACGGSGEGRGFGGRLLVAILGVQLAVAGCWAAPATKREGMDLLLAAAAKAGEVSWDPQGNMLGPGAEAVDLCRAALAAGVQPSVGGDGHALMVELRPLFRFLRARAEHAQKRRDAEVLLESCRTLLGVAEPFSGKVSPSNREVGLVADIYAIPALNEAIDQLSAEQCQEMIDAINRYLAAWASAKEIMAQRPDLPQGGPEVSRLLADEQERLAMRLKTWSALYRMVVVKLALRREFLATGRFPPNLQRLKVSVTDPFSAAGAAFGYRLDQGGYRLYSIGPDGRDDGGAVKSLSALLAGERGDLSL